MKVLIYIIMIIIFIYTTGFSVTLWKEKNKFGSMVVFFLALIVAIAPFFTILK